MQTSVNGVALHYEISGAAKGPWVTFSHSLAASSAMWSRQIEYLTPRYRILTYDFRGHGKSPAASAPFTPMDLVNDIEGLLAKLAIEKTHFVGLSLGGMIGQGLALHYPDRLHSLVACNCRSDVPPAGMAGWKERIALVQSSGIDAIVEPTLQRWFAPGFEKRRPEVAAAVRAMIAGTSAEGYIGCANALMQVAYRARLHRISVPTMFICGAQDGAAPPAEMRAMHEAVPGSAYCGLDPAGHISNIDDTPGFNQALAAFLQKVDEGNGSNIRTDTH